MTVYRLNFRFPRSSFAGFALVVAATAALTFLGSFGGCKRASREQEKKASKQAGADADAPAVKVGVFTVKTEPVPLIRELPGRTTASNVAEVRPQINGVVLKRLFNEGANVVEGQPLYEIDSSVYAARVAKEQANVANLEALKNRAEKLKEKDAGSVQEYEDALYSWEKAKAELQLAQLDLDYCTIVAPISGRVGFSTITVGALVTNGQTEALTTIQQLDPIYVDLNPSTQMLIETRDAVDENGEKRSFMENANVSIVLEGDLKFPFTGKVKYFSNKIQEDVGTLTLRAEFPNKREMLLPGMFVRAFVEEGVRKDGMLIPQEAVFRTPKGAPYVWVVKDDSTVERRSIESKRTLGNMLLVDSGLKAGERLVVVGTQFISDGVRVDASEDETIPKTTSFERFGIKTAEPSAEPVQESQPSENAPESAEETPRAVQTTQTSQNVPASQDSQTPQSVQEPQK